MKKHQAMSPAEEAALVSRVRAGDADAFGLLYDRHRPGLRKLVTTVLGDPVAAEDVVQEAFLRAWLYLPSFDPSRPLFRWLASIAINRAHDVAARNARLQIGDPPEIGWDTTVEAVMNTDSRRRLRTALATLSPRARRTLLLHDLDGYTCAEIAEHDGSTEWAIRALLVRTRARMRRVLETVVITIGSVRLWIRRRAPRLSLSVESGTALTAAAANLLLSFAFMAPPTTAASASTVYERRQAGEPARAATARMNASQLGPASNSPIDVSIGRPRDRAPIPPDTHLSVEVRGPDGTVLYRNTTWVECSETQPELTPDSSPVRTAC